MSLAPMVRAALLGLALGGCTLFVDPDLSRIGELDGGVASVDAWTPPLVDAWTPPAVDAWTPPIDDDDGGGLVLGAGVGDANDCGPRRLRCADGQLCIDDRCACAPPMVLLRDRTCADLTHDPANCGAVGFGCPARCAGGSCVGNCPDGTLDCDGSCTDIARDTLNCGGCGFVCDAGEVCVLGECERVEETPTCLTCPCAECGGGHVCCPFEDPEVALCVEGDLCP